MSWTEDPRLAPALRWGVLGPGWISDRFVAALQAETAQQVVAVGSRSVERARAFASKWEIPTTYNSYDGLVADPDVDVIYVATPHSHHREQALLAIAAGKHVLVEKSFTRNAAEAREIVTAAREKGVFCMEAMWTRFLPHMVALRQLINDGAVGDIISLRADHGQFFPYKPEHRLYNPQLAGGALLDLGIYPVSFAHNILGTPSRVHAVGSQTQTGVDGQVSMIFTYDSPAHADLSTTLWSRTDASASIAGTAGRIDIDDMFYAPTSFTLRRLNGTVMQFQQPLTHGLHFQAAEVARRVSAGEKESPLMGLDESVAIMTVLDEIRAQIGVQYPGE